MEEVWRVTVRRRAVAALVGMTVAAPNAYAQQPPPGPQNPRIGEVLPDTTVRFNIGSAELTDRSKATLDRLALLLKRRVELSPVLLVGHADDRGSDDLNQRLSRGRAEVVKAALVARGIRARRLTTEGAGSREPLSLEDSEAARTLNRRVEIWVTPRVPAA